MSSAVSVREPAQRKIWDHPGTKSFKISFSTSKKNKKIPTCLERFFLIVLK